MGMMYLLFMRHFPSQRKSPKRRRTYAYKCKRIDAVTGWGSEPYRTREEVEEWRKDPSFDSATI